MADTKITALTAITTVDPAVDVLPIVDVSDTTMAASGTTKKITSNQILGAGGTATLASATITGDLTVDTSTLKVDSANNRVGVGTASPIDVFQISSQNPNIYLTDSGIAGSDQVNLYFGPNTIPTYSGILVDISNDNFNIRHNSSTRLSIGSTGIFTWQNVGGVAGTAMTLNSTGLGVGGSPSYKLSSIGTTNNQVVLHVGNTAGTVDGDTTNVVRFAAGSGANALWANARYDGFSHAWRCNSTTTQAMTLDASGRLLVGPTSANASGGVLQLSSGITFPATQVASSDANTLDDYEEGTWTATLKGSVSDPTTPVTATGRYTKIGRQVSIQLFVNNVTTTGASGRIQIDGLPFANNGSVEAISNVGFYNIATFTGVPFGLTSASSTVIDMWSSVSSGVFQAVNYNPGSVQYVWVNLTYTV